MRFSREMNAYFSVLSSQSRSALSLISRPFVWPARSFSTFAQIRALLQSKKYTEVINIVLKMAFKRLKFQGFFIVESALSLSSWFTGPALKYLETNNSNTNITGLKTQLAGGNQLAIYKRGREFELGTTEHKSSKWPERDSNPGPPDCESDALTTRPRCLLGVKTIMQ